MTWTYASPLSGNRDKIRTYIGDTDSTDPLLSDEQITYAYNEEGTVKGAAALAAEWIAIYFARQADKSVGDLSITYSNRAAQYKALAASLGSKSVKFCLPYFGGISETAKETREDDTDRVEPAFKVDMLDNPETDLEDSDGDVS